MLERSVVHAVRVLDLLVLLLGGEALLLHTCAVKNIAASENLRSKSLRLAEKLAGSNELLSDLGRQRQCLGSNELNLDVVVSEKVHQRVHRSAVEKITNEGDGQALNSTQLLTDGEEIEERLCGVLLAAVATVDDRHGTVLLGNVDAALLRVTEDDGITVASQGTEGILEGLTLLNGRVLGGNGDGATTKTLHSSIERSRGAGRGFVEERGQDAASENVQDTLTLNTKTHLLGNGEEKVEISSAVRLDGQNVSVLERRRPRQQLLERRADHRLELQSRAKLSNSGRVASSTRINTTKAVQRLETT
jgi:hypothetical protein